MDQKHNIQWKTIEEEIDGIKVIAKWWDKDYSVYYESKYGLMRYGLHIMYMIPKIYTEEEIRGECKSMAPIFKQAEELISKNENEFGWLFDDIKSYSKTIDKTMDHLNELKRIYKADFKENKLTQQEYQKKVSPIESLKEDLKIAKSNYIKKASDSFCGSENYILKSVISYCVNWKLKELEEKKKKAE